LKLKENICTTSLAAAAFVLFFITIITSIALADNGQGALPTITETQITTSGVAGIPAIYGDKIVWDDWRNKELSPNSNGKTDIYMYNLSTSTETQITFNRSGVFPAIYNDIIVWSDNRSGNRNIYMYNLSTLKEVQISANGADQIWPDIYGNNIVWQNYLNGDSDIFIYNIFNHNETQITSSKSAVFPSIFKDRIIWSDNRSGNWDIYMYNLSTSQEIQISTSGSAAFSCIYEDKVVWSDYHNGTGDLFLYNLSTSKKTQITKNESVYNPAIYGDKIVWANYLNGSSNIFMYDLSTSQEYQISASESALFPAIYGNRVVWTNELNGNFDIYMATIGYPPVAEFTASFTSEAAPLNVTFTDKSTGTPTTWNWSFGDGTYSTKQNPVHTYLIVGNYTVNLTVSNANGIDSKLATITILTPMQIIQQTIYFVQGLVTLNHLNSGTGDILIATLNTAKTSLNSGDTIATIIELKAFISKVQVYINLGIISPSDGETLIREANIVINLIKNNHEAISENV
jgi:beta propeller repeat protein